MNFSTIPEMFIKTCKKYGNVKPVYKFKRDGKYVGLSYNGLKENVENFAIGLKDLGIKAGDRVGIVSENRIEWIVADFAISGIGAVDVPIFPTLTTKQEEYIYNDCQAAAIIVSNNFQLSKILEFKERIPSLRHIIVMNNEFDAKDPAVKSMVSVLQRGSQIKTKEEKEMYFEELCSRAKPDDLLTLIYTSGTTGNPKGVMLTHNNIISNIKSIIKMQIFDDSDTFLSFLPLCHAYERTTGYYAAFGTGSTVALAESLETVGANINETQPTIMTTVPRLLEIVKKKIFNNMAKESQAKQKIFNWAVDTGKAYIRAQKTNKIPMSLKTKYKLADKLVFGKIREKTGGNLDRFVSGGASLPDEVCEFYLAAGFKVLEGYGLTESSPVASVNRMDSIEIGTIGKPLPDVEVKIAGDGEILIRGGLVMKGYWNDPIATEEAIDEDGWLYSGDIGKFTESGNIKITDRKKNIFVSSGGKNIAPQPIENVLSQSDYIEHVVLVGDKREYITALITPDFEELRNLAKHFNFQYKTDTDLITCDKCISAIKQDIDRLQKDFAKYERVRKFKVLSQPFTIENGELTPKMSIKRHVVERKYHHLIDSMYGVK